MNLEDSLKLERYKLVTARQAWVVDVARSVFTGYATTLAAFVGGAVSLTFATNAVSRLGAAAVQELLFLLATFITCVAVASIFQIGFCLWRWYEFREAECKLYSSAPKPEGWAKYFELAFVAMMGGSVALVWLGYFSLKSIVQLLPT